MRTTVCLLRDKPGLDFDRYVDRVFRDANTAHKYQNGLDHNVTVRRLEGIWHKGDRVPFNTPTQQI